MRSLPSLLRHAKNVMCDSKFQVQRSVSSQVFLTAADDKKVQPVGVPHVATCVARHYAAIPRYYVCSHVSVDAHCLSVNVPEIEPVVFLKARHPAVGKLIRDLFAFGKENVCIVQKNGCAELYDIIAKRDLAVVLIR